MQTFNLEKFVSAQERVYPKALQEIKQGRKATHWMWYIFPQIKGLGFSDISKRYAIENIQEAAAYLAHPLLGARLIEITTVLINLNTSDAHAIFGSPDDMKLRSCMTLFSTLKNAEPVFTRVLDKYFGGKGDAKTLEILAGT